MVADAPRAAIVGLAGAVLEPAELALLRRFEPLGIILFRRNIVSPGQLQELVGRLREVLPPGSVLMVDQEGGRVARLRGPHWREHPTPERIGRLHARDHARGLRGAFLSGALIGLDCAGAGFDVVCAPVLDRGLADAHGVIGDRAFGAEADTIAPLASAFADGLLAACVQPVGKHVPGHGRAMLDSHLALPELDRIEDADLAPFRMLRWLPWMMTAHIRYRENDAQNPATCSRSILQEVVRGQLGFENLLVSDDLAMHALDGPSGRRASIALQAGCDVALHCSGVLAESHDVLEAVPPLPPDALARLGRARALARERKTDLDGASMAAEREELLR